MMFRSFLTVGSGYVLCWILFMAIATALGYLFYPEFIDFLRLDVAARKTIMEDDPSKAIPHAMFGWMVVLNALGCLATGWLVARTAPFSAFSHGVFLAVLLFIMYLQIAIADPAAKKWMDVIYLGVLPISVLQGARWGSPRMESQTEDSD